MKRILKMASRSWLMHLVFMILGMLVLPSLLSGSFMWLGIILNIGLIAGFMLLMYSEGAYKGEKDVTSTAYLTKRIEEGYHPTEEDNEKRYAPTAAWMACILGALPLIVIALLALASSFVVSEDSNSFINISSIVARVVFSPYLLVYTMFDSISTYALPLAFPVFSWFLPLAYTFGYLSGPKQREKKLKMLAAGVKKKLRKQRMEKKKRDNAPKPEV